MQLSKEPLLPEEAIQQRIRELADEISRDYRDRPLRVLIVLKGSVLFGADLVKQLKTDLKLDFVRAKSYVGTQTTGNVEFLYTWEEPFTDEHVLLVEDIIDTGCTASKILHRIREDNPASVAICTLLDKPAHRVEEVNAEYVGFYIEDHFVVGYGLDYDERYRQLPAIHTLENQ